MNQTSATTPSLQDPSHCLIYNAFGKHNQGNEVENHLAVRFLYPDLCPISATADLVILDLSQPAKPHAGLLQGHLVRAPSTTGSSPMASSTISSRMKDVLLKAGVRCDLVVYEGGKAETTHGLKKLAVNVHRMQGLDREDVQIAAGHLRGLTDRSYATTTDVATMHKVAGFGINWREQHWLGRGSVSPTMPCWRRLLRDSVSWRLPWQTMRSWSRCCR